MSPLLQQFISESRDLLQSISEQLLAVEKSDDKQTTLNELFRLVHTLKGNTGLFEFPELTRVLHAGEDVMSEARENTALWDQSLTDLLFDAMDYVGQFCDSIEETDGNPKADQDKAEALAISLRKYLDKENTPAPEKAEAEKPKPKPKPAAKRKTTSRAKKTTTATEKEATTATEDKKPATRKTTRKKVVKRPDVHDDINETPEFLSAFSEADLRSAWQSSNIHDPLWLITYTPIKECFFQGDDPLHAAMMTPGVIWGSVSSECKEVDINDLDPYQCVSVLFILSNATKEEIQEHFRYVPDQIKLLDIMPLDLLQLCGTEQQDAIASDTLEELTQAIDTGDTDTVLSITTAALELMNADLTAACALRWLDAIGTDSQLDNADRRSAMMHIMHRLRYDQHQPAFDFAEGVTAAESSAPATAEVSQPPAELSDDDREALEHILRVQRRILELSPEDPWSAGRISAVTNVLHNCFYNLGLTDAVNTIKELSDAALNGQTDALMAWIDAQLPGGDPVAETQETDTTEIDPDEDDESDEVEGNEEDDVDDDELGDEEDITASDEEDTAAPIDTPARIVDTSPVSEPVPPMPQEPVTRTAIDDADSKAAPAIGTSRSVKVDQEKIDRLMNLIGEMIVAKNALPFLAKRAEEQHGLREMAREIKEQYAVVNRIAEEMQDSIMQIRMMPFSFISMRFPRLVRDISRRLNKEVQLIIEGEDTEADKNIIESLAEPLIHIVRNSLDHGIEMPDVRTKAGKSAAGTLTIKASQEADRVMIEIHDDGKGIDPEVIRQKAFEKGLIDDATRQRLTDREAVNLVLLPGFSTAEAISDLSGRGVGMDAVRSAVEKVNGTMALDSEPGKGTRIRISLPMSIAVTRVMIVESDNQLMGVPMDQVLETVRVPRSEIYTVKHVQTTVLRDRIVPLKSLNHLLALPSPQVINEEEEHAVLVARVGNDVIGLIVDDFRGSVDIIQKPMAGVLSGIQAYSGAALIGDGSVLMVLNLKEIL